MAPFGSGASGQLVATHCAAQASSAACSPLTRCSIAASAAMPSGSGESSTSRATLFGVRSGVGQRDLGAVADAEQREVGHVPRAAQPFDVLGGVPVVVGRGAGRDGVGAGGGGGLRDGVEVGDGVVAGLELGLVDHFLPVRQVAAVQRGRHPGAAAVDRHDRMRLEHVGACAGQPHRQLGRRRQIRTGGHHQWPGVLRGLRRAGPHHADADGSVGAVDRIEVGVIAGAVQRDAGQRRHGGVTEYPRRAVPPGQVVLRRCDRRRARAAAWWSAAHPEGARRHRSQTAD